MTSTPPVRTSLLAQLPSADTQGNPDTTYLYATQVVNGRTIDVRVSISQIALMIGGVVPPPVQEDALLTLNGSDLLTLSGDPLLLLAA